MYRANRRLAWENNNTQVVAVQTIKKLFDICGINCVARLVFDSASIAWAVCLSAGVVPRRARSAPINNTPRTSPRSRSNKFPDCEIEIADWLMLQRRPARAFLLPSAAFVCMCVQMQIKNKLSNFFVESNSLHMRAHRNFLPPFITHIFGIPALSTS